MPRWFPRRRRLDLGRFVPPASLPPASVDELVEEGVLLAGAAVRLAVTNLMVVRSVRDRLDYDEERYVRAVREELENLAHEKDADAARLERVHDDAAQRSGRPVHHSDYRAVDADTLERRGEVSRALADRLRLLSGDETWARGVVVEARERALEAIEASVAARADRTPWHEDEDYHRQRPERLRALAEDLLLLQITPPTEGDGV